MAHNEAGRMLRDIASSDFDMNIDISTLLSANAIREFDDHVLSSGESVPIKYYNVDEASDHTCNGIKRNKLFELRLVTVCFWFEPSSNLIPFKLKRHSARKKKRKTISLFACMPDAHSQIIASTGWSLFRLDSMLLFHHIETKRMHNEKLLSFHMCSSCILRFI